MAIVNEMSGTICGAGTDLPAESLRYCSDYLLREVNVGEGFGDVRVVVAVPIPRPSRAGVQTLTVLVDLLEPRTIDPPDVPIPGRE